ncbi:hypothetical protein HPP92_026111 [Vanilla planifolia]|uniref:Uncharacterized protein n=1 Tax=Vanilla planifolia TaxID=51239 RepID=A0A835U8S2_VANPL|nr:hypothetical protein HPP92_026111 [Vanilla planifolia]
MDSSSIAPPEVDSSSLNPNDGTKTEGQISALTSMTMTLEAIAWVKEMVYRARGSATRGLGDRNHRISRGGGRTGISDDRRQRQRASEGKDQRRLRALQGWSLVAASSTLLPCLTGMTFLKFLKAQVLTFEA